MKRILVIEDSAEFREYVAEILRLSGFALLEAPDAAQGRQLAHDSHPDLIVCDLHLPDVDGFTAMETIQHEDGPVPFVILSADGGESQMQRSMELGAEAYIVKPIAINDLIRIVRRCVADIPEAA